MAGVMSFSGSWGAVCEAAGGLSWAGLALVWAVAGVAALYAYMVWPVREVRHIPCPPYRVPGLGHLPLLGKEEAEVFVRLARQHGPVYRFHFGRRPIVMVADAELCRELSIKQFKSATDRANPAYIETVPLLQHALFFSRGKTWSTMRNIALPFYHSDPLRKCIPPMCHVADAMVQHLETIGEHEEVNMSHFNAMFTLDVIGETAFDAKFQMVKSISTPSKGNKDGSTLETKLVHSCNNFIDSLRLDGNAPLSTIIGELFPFLQWPLRKVLGSIPGTADWHMEQHTRTVMDTLTEILVKRQAEEDLDARGDMLSLLLNARKTNPLLTNDYINGLTFETLLVGSETTAVSLSCCLYLISGHPHVQEKLVREIDAFGPLPPHLSPDDLQKFPYVEQCFKEALRLYAPAPVVARYIAQDMKLGGYDLKKGTHVWMTSNAVMRDPTHFKDPEEYKPERFDVDCKENKERHPGAFMPFGLGPRACIGSKFSMQEAKIALIKIYKKFTFTHSPTMEKPLSFNFGIVRRPKYGVKLRVHPRT